MPGALRLRNGFTRITTIRITEMTQAEFREMVLGDELAASAANEMTFGEWYAAMIIHYGYAVPRKLAKSIYDQIV